MWTRKELKDKAKVVFRASYWKMVLVSLILLVISGGFGAGSSYRFNQNDSASVASVLENNAASATSVVPSTPSLVWIAGFIIGFLVVFTICLSIGFLLSAFITNPLLVGIRRFFTKSLNESCQIREVAFAFDHSYMNVVKTMFFRDLYVFLWSLLFLIPGIVKSYEYRMIPYLLAQNPDMTKEEAFLKSKEMMQGEKWNTFVLDLSFIGWGILNVITLGILAIFYVGPYKNLTNAALFAKLSGEALTEEDSIIEY